MGFKTDILEVESTINYDGTNIDASATELNFVQGVTSAIQTQINLKAPLANPIFTGTVILPSTTSIGDTSSTDISYLSSRKVYEVLITQTGTDAPTATEMYITAGVSVVWTYSSVGTFIGTSVGLFTAKTFIPAHLQNMVDKFGVTYRLEKLNENTVQLTTLENGVLANGKLTNFPIQFNIYN